MIEALKTHIDMFPEVPEGFAWEVCKPQYRYGRMESALVAITYWVEYAPSAEGDGRYTVFRAYSHRMQLEQPS